MGLECQAGQSSRVHLAGQPCPSRLIYFKHTNCIKESKEKGQKLDKLTQAELAPLLGNARLVTVTKEQTTIVDGKGSEDLIKARAEEIKEQIEKATSMFEKEKLQERLGKLVGGVAIINVGGGSDIEIKEKKDRVEDSLLATKAALADGIVPGCGMALYNASDKLVIDGTKNKSFELGYDIVKEAIKEPFKKILSNSGIENWYEIIASVKSSELEKPTFDAKSELVVDSIQSGIIDPTKVVTTALKNAASVAGTILTTESVIYAKKEKGDKPASDPMMGMGM